MSALLTSLLIPQITKAINSTTAQNSALATDQSLSSAAAIQQKFIFELSQAIAVSVQTYLNTNVVVQTTSLTVNTGIPVQAQGGDAFVVGQTTSTGTGFTAPGTLKAN